MNTARTDAGSFSRQEIIRLFYESRLGSGRQDLGAFEMGSEEIQEIQFERLTHQIPLGNKQLLEVGCGPGNLLQYLNKKGMAVEYTGVDLLESMIQTARSKRLNGWFLNMDLFRSDFFDRSSFDVVFSAGLFDLNLGNNKSFLVKAMRKFIYLSREWVIVGLLHDRSRYKDEAYFYFKPEEVSIMIQKHFSRYVTTEIYEDNPYGVFTVICRKKNNLAS